MKKKQNNYAFIDSQNANLAIREQGWVLDFKRFRKYLSDKYHITKAFLFIGYIPANQPLYAALQESGYILIYKPTLQLPDGTVKGNVDAELVLHAMIEYKNYEKAVIVTGDGDFYCLVKYLFEKDKLSRLLVPNRFKYSVLLKRASPSGKYIAFMNDLRHRLEHKKRHRDEPMTPAGGST